MDKKYKTLFHAVENNTELETIPFDTIAKAVKNCTTPTRTVQSFSKKEVDFLIDWLSDDFDLALEEFMNSSEVDFTPTLKNLKSIIKKLKGGK